jgi:hypothetical protein
VRRLATRWLALLAAALLAGCSVMQTAYDNADRYLRWRAGGYFDVQGEQLEDLERRIERFHAWHRAEALPQYARLAEEAGERVARGLSQDDLLWGYDALATQIRQGVRAAAEHGAPLLDRLNDEQIEHLGRRLAEDNRRYARKFLRGTADERKNGRARRTIARLEEWVGRLTQEQAGRVRQYSERAPLADELRERERQRLQGELLALTRERQAQTQLPARAAHWERGRDPELDAAAALQRRELFAMLLDVERMLSPGQRARAIARLREHAADFRELAARGQSRSAGR